MAIADASVWVAGARVADEVPLDRIDETAHERGGFAWIDLVDPTEAELHAVAAELGLHHLLIEDVASRGQRPKLEAYGDIDYCVVHRVAAERDELVAREVHAIVGPRWIVTVSWDDPDGCVEVHRLVLDGIETLELSPRAVLYALLDTTGDEIEELAERAREGIERLEDGFFGDESVSTVEIYRAMRRVLALQRAAEPLSPIVARLSARLGEHDEELRRHLRDVDDHADRTSGRLVGDRDLLSTMLQLASARGSERQNEEMRRMTEQTIVQNEQTKKVTSWAAILFAPTLVAGIYGMNFRFMPELDWPLGYPLAILAMVAFMVGLWAAFKRKEWL